MLCQVGCTVRPALVPVELYPQRRLHDRHGLASSACCSRPEPTDVAKGSAHVVLSVHRATCLRIAGARLLLADR